MKLLVTLNPDRDIPGTLEEASGALTGLPCLGRSDNTSAAKAGNATRNPVHQMGDTPTGKYTARLCPASTNHARFGPYQRLLLDPYQGPALQAKRNGRTGLMIHGGDPSKNGSRGGLRPTNGCIRVSNSDMARIIRFLSDNKLQEIDLEVQEQA